MSATRKPEDVPQFFRLNIEVGDLDAAAAFYGTLLGLEGGSSRGAAATSIAGPLPCKCWMCPRKGSRTQRQSLCILLSRI